MAIRQLAHYRDERFRKKSKPVKEFDEKLWELLGDMGDTLARAGGLGCAAVHVGVLKRVVLVLYEGRRYELVNPTIAPVGGETQLGVEGSIAPGAPRGYVERPQAVTVEAFDRHGNPLSIRADGLLAAIFCHEIEHLDGTMYSDRFCQVHE